MTARKGAGQGSKARSATALVKVEPPDLAADVLARVLDGSWEPGSSDASTAAAHGVPIEHVRRVAADAARLVAKSHGEDAEIARGFVLARLAGLERKALERRRAYLRKDGSVIEAPDPDVASAVKVEALIASVLGIQAAAKVDLTARTDTSQTPPDDLARGALEFIRGRPELHGLLLEAADELRLNGAPLPESEDG